MNKSAGKTMDSDAACTAPINTAELMERLVLNRRQVAELLGVNENCISYLHRLGRLQGVPVGKELRWRPADVRAFVESLEPTR